LHTLSVPACDDLLENLYELPIASGIFILDILHKSGHFRVTFSGFPPPLKERIKHYNHSRMCKNSFSVSQKKKKIVLLQITSIPAASVAAQVVA